MSTPLRGRPYVVREPLKPVRIIPRQRRLEDELYRYSLPTRVAAWCFLGCIGILVWLAFFWALRQIYQVIP
jgi:hypothetical protein